VDQQEIKLILLSNRSEYLIGVVTELDEEPSYLVANCFEVKSEEELVAFPRFSSQRDVFLTSEAVFTIVDPSPKLLETYETA